MLLPQALKGYTKDTVKKKQLCHDNLKKNKKYIFFKKI